MVPLRLRDGRGKDEAAVQTKCADELDAALGALPTQNDDEVLPRRDSRTEIDAPQPTPTDDAESKCPKCGSEVAGDIEEDDGRPAPFVYCVDCGDVYEKPSLDVLMGRDKCWTEN